MSLKELVNEVLNETGYVAELAAENTDEPMAESKILMN